jgi:hypothetical protein
MGSLYEMSELSGVKLVDLDWPDAIAESYGGRSSGSRERARSRACTTGP